MEVMYRRCAGLDVHQHTVMACARVVDKHKVQQEVETFQTTVKGLAALRSWLQGHGCTHAALESTGVYWIPLYQILVDRKMAVCLVNARQFTMCQGGRPT